MSILGFLFGGDSSSSSSSSNTQDNQIGNSGAGDAIRIESPTAPITIGSDAVATTAINAVANNATAVENLFSNGLTGLFQNLNNAQQAASTAVAASQAQASNTVSNATATPADNFTTLIAVAGAIILGYFLLKKG